MSLFDFGARLLRQLPAETAHTATLTLAGALRPLLPTAAADDAKLHVRAFGLDRDESFSFELQDSAERRGPCASLLRQRWFVLRCPLVYGSCDFG